MRRQVSGDLFHTAAKPFAKHSHTNEETDLLGPLRTGPERPRAVIIVERTFPSLRNVLSLHFFNWAFKITGENSSETFCNREKENEATHSSYGSALTPCCDVLQQESGLSQHESDPQAVLEGQSEVIGLTRDNWGRLVIKERTNLSNRSSIEIIISEFTKLRERVVKYKRKRIVWCK